MSSLAGLKAFKLCEVVLQILKGASYLLIIIFMFITINVYGNNNILLFISFKTIAATRNININIARNRKSVFKVFIDFDHCEKMCL